MAMEQRSRRTSLNSLVRRADENMFRMVEERLTTSWRGAKPASYCITTSRVRFARRPFAHATSAMDRREIARAGLVNNQ